MKRSFRRVTVVVVLSVVCFMTGLMPAYAQATRTWVSGVGDDVNPCSRTAPCKTFAGAISKTAAKGEINALDPGGFGAVTITKSITIDGGPFTAGVLTNAANAINVNVTANDNVILRNLDIDGLGTAATGINFINGGTLHVSKVTIQGFATVGINAANTVAGRAIISDVEIRNNPGGGITVGGSGGSSAMITDSTIEHNSFGVRATSNGVVTVSNTSALTNINNGFEAVGGPGNAFMNVNNSVSAHNGGGILATGGGVTVRIRGNAVFNNGAGLAGSSIVSFGGNVVAGNFSDGAPTSTVATV